MDQTAANDALITEKMMLYLSLFLLLSHFLCAAPPPWIDLPADNYTHILGCDGPLACALNDSIKKYTDVPKSFLAQRLEALTEVENILTQWSDEEHKGYLKQRLEELRTIAANKKWYLEQLLECYTLGKFEDDYLNRTLRQIPELKEGRKALCMINERRYHTKYGEYWGEYWLEAMDPCHRQLMTYRDRWTKGKEKEPSLPPFFLWLEDQNLSKDVPYLNYLSDELLENSRVTLKNGLLYFSDVLISPDDNREFLFIVDLEERLLLAEGSQLIHHNSLSHSKPVLAVGKMEICAGCVQVLSFESGHYIPTVQDDLRMILLLKEMGVPLSDAIPLIYYDSGGCQKVSLGDFLENTRF